MNLTRSFTAFTVVCLSVVSAIEVSESRPEIVHLRSSVETSEHVSSSMADMVEEFEEWMEKFGKSYHSVEERFKRLKVWVANHEFIQAHNNQTPKSSHTVAHNKFSDMTSDEFQKLHNLGKYSPGVDAIRESQRKRKELAAMNKVGDMEHSVMEEFRYLRSLSKNKSINGFFDDQWYKDDDDTNTDDNTDTDDNAETDDTAETDDDDTNGLPDSVDWVANGAVTPIKNQASCGSCWAFSATGAIEGASFVKYGELIALSEQNLLDCDKIDNGCNGGLMDNAFKFDETAHGLCSETDYPYLATDGHECLTDCEKVPGSVVADYNDLEESDKHGLIASLVMQPTSVAMQADQLSFQFYSSGVFSEADCGEDGAIDHGVLAVGYGTDEDSGKNFFKIKNSWGEDWGESGYFRLDRKSKNQWGTCAILMIMTAPIIA